MARGGVLPALISLAMSGDEQRELHATAALANMAEMVEGRTQVIKPTYGIRYMCIKPTYGALYMCIKPTYSIKPTAGAHDRGGRGEAPHAAGRLTQRGDTPRGGQVQL
jgi:hypothetical protein